MAMRRQPIQSRHTRTAGFSLVEMAMSLVIVSFIMLSVGSLMVLAARTANVVLNGTNPQSGTARLATEQIADDLSVAMSIPEQTATAVTVTVPDRLGTGAPNMVRYAWSTAGGSLTRTVNNNASESIADNVQSFALSYTTRTVGQNLSISGPYESAEQTLMSHDYSGSNLSTFAPTQTALSAQYIKPTLPADAISWHVTHITLEMAKNGLLASGQLIFQVRTADATGVPTSTVLASATIDASVLPLLSAAYVDISFTNLTGLDPTQGLCLVFAGSNSSGPVMVYYQSSVSPAFAGFTACSSSNSGTTWSTPVTTSVCNVYVYGTVTSP